MKWLTRYFHKQKVQAILICCTPLLISPQAHADIYAYPDNDTHVSLQLTNYNYNLDLLDEDTGRQLEFQPNVHGLITPKLAYRDLFAVAWSFKLAETPYSDEIYGNTDYTDFRFSFTYRQFHIETHYSQFSGFYLFNTEEITGDPLNFVQRPDLYVRSMGASFTWVWNPETFSMPHLIDQAERQEKSGGSFLLGGSFVNSRFRADSNLVPVAVAGDFRWLNEVNAAQFTTLAAQVGYGYIYGSKWYIGGAILAGPGLSKQVVDFESDRREDNVRASVHAELYLSGGYQGDEYFVTLNAKSIADTYYLNDSTSRVTGTVLATSLAFGAHTDFLDHVFYK